MDVFKEIIRYFSLEDQKEMKAFSGFLPTEIRVRTGRRIKISWVSGESECGGIVTAKELLLLISRMLDHSIYAWEDELGEGYFTLPFGVRVGVSGKFSVGDGKKRMVMPVSLLIRIAREAKGCAEPIKPFLIRSASVQNMILLSPPGMGKTTLLRDACRLLSEAGKEICVVDERGEIAAIRNGEAQLDAGERTDVCEGLSKAEAIMTLIRSMSPNVVVVDEIGSYRDSEAISEAARMGVAILASAHASSITDALERPMLGNILSAQIFQIACVLGGYPGNIKAVYEFSEGKWRLK